MKRNLWHFASRSKPVKNTKLFTQTYKMLSPHARSGIYHIFHISCVFKCIPYDWDKVKHQLAPATRLGMKFYSFNQLYFLYYLLSGWIRYNLRSKDKESQHLSPIEECLSIVWSLAALTIFVCLYQMRIRRWEIMSYGNRLLERVINKEERASSGLAKRSRQPDGMEGISRLISLEVLGVYVNPTAHWIVMFCTPCTPFFISSMYKCETGFKVREELHDFVLFVVECYSSYVFVYVMASLWVLLYLGLAEVELELKKLE